MRVTALLAIGALIAIVFFRPAADRHSSLPPSQQAGTRDSRSLSINGRAFGTSYSVNVFNAPAQFDSRQLGTASDEVLQRIDREMSIYRDDSELSRFNTSRGTDWFPVSSETVCVIDEALRISKVSHGAFDVTVDPLVRLWGFGPQRHSNLPAPAAIEEARSRVGYQFLETRRDPPALRKSRPEVSLDLGAIAKGYAADAVAERLEQLGIFNYLVAIGGELHAKGQSQNGRPWRTAIEKPLEYANDMYCVVELTDRCIATCGNYRNFHSIGGKRYCHIIDPHTGKPVEHDLASVTVVCASTMEADAMGTALMVMGPEAGVELARSMNLPALFLRRDGEKIIEIATPEFERLRVHP